MIRINNDDQPVIARRWKLDSGGRGKISKVFRQHWLQPGLCVTCGSPASARLRDAVNCVAALRANFARIDLPNALGSFDRNALAPFQLREEAPDCVGPPPSGLGDLGDGGALWPA